MSFVMPHQLEIVLLGHPLLRDTASPVEDVEDSRFQELIDNMIATMQSAGGVGLAAPQVGESLRLFVMQSRPSERYPEAPEMPPTAVINPRIVDQADEVAVDWEGCLSMPGYKGIVPRPTWVKAAWVGRDGEPVEMKLQSLPARVFFHELDHLDGVMYLERMESSLDLISTEMSGNSPTDEKLLRLRQNRG